MLRNYIKIAWRNLVKHKAISFINLVGLSLSVAFCFLLFLHIQYERSYDSFHQKKDRLFRLEMTNEWDFGGSGAEKKTGLLSFLSTVDEKANQIVFPLIVGPDMQRQFSDVKSITRYKDAESGLVKVDNQVYKEAHIFYADDNFFTNFSFPLRQGNAYTVLSSRNGVVVSASVARKYFGRQNPVGRTLVLTDDTSHVYVVTGVAENAPGNSSLQFDLVFPMTAYPSYLENIQQRFNQCDHIFMVELANGVSVSAFQQKLNQWVKVYFASYIKGFKDANPASFQWYLRPLSDCHYVNAGQGEQGWGHYTNAGNLYELACLVAVILLIASLNYVLLTVSNAVARSQEVGVRKVMGARKGSIIQQFWVETQVVVLLAVLVGFGLTWVLLPAFNSLMGIHLRFSDFSLFDMLIGIPVLSIGLGLLAGYYPALLLSKMKAVSVMKSFRTLRINPRFSRILVVTQYTACIILMMAAFVINRQMQFVSDKDLGFDKDQVLMLENPTWDKDFTRHVRSRLSTFAQTEPSILEFSGMNGGLDGSYNTSGFTLNGQQQWVRQLTVDFNYFHLLGLKIVQGRAFSPDFSMDTSTSRTIRPTVVNETLFRLLGKSAKVGVYNDAIRSTIIGVVKDYNFETLSKTIQPEQHMLTRGYEGWFLLKLRAGQTRTAIDRIEKEWKVATGNYPFKYTFLDDSINRMYASDTQWQQIIRTSCLFAVFISCLGLFGLSAVNAANRTKEIGIRKVLGAGVTDIVALLSGHFITMVLIALVIAIPISWGVMNQWLDDFAYRIHLSVWMFALVGGTAMVIALLTVGFQALKSATANPVDSLKVE